MPKQPQIPTVERVVRALNVLIVFLTTLLVVAAFISMLASCVPHPAQREKIWPTGAPPTRGGNSTWFWCAAASSDQHEGLMGCSDTLDTCNEGRRDALRWGGLLHIATIGECVQIEVEP